jgi:short-subunit dehydrogenase
MKKAVVIGATSGIGKGLALALAKHNYKVGITARRIELLREIERVGSGSFLSKRIDITKPDESLNLLNELVQELGGMDLLIISSGIGDFNPDLNYAVENSTIETNVIGFTAVAGWAFNYFQNQKSGHLLGISSIAGLRGSGYAPAYNASKAFQRNYLEGLRQKAAMLGYPITVTDICPGFVDTAMAKGDALFWVAPVEKAVGQIVDAIIRKKRSTYVTKRWLFIAVFLKLIPERLYNRI